MKHIFIATVALSMVLGGIVGGVAGIAATSWSTRTILPWAQQFAAGGGNVAGGIARVFSQPVVESSATIDVVEQSSPAVVSIVVTQDLSKLYNRTGPYSPFDEFFFGYPYAIPPPTGKQEVGGGSGFIITTDGMIVTNRHVVDRQEAEYSVVLNDGTKYDAHVLARDYLNDIAILKIDADNLPILSLGDSEQIKIGQTVIAIGNSLGEFRNTVTKGVVSGIDRRVVAGDSNGFSEVIEAAIQTDAAINPGNSGGPLLDLFGAAIGVNTAVSRQGQLIGFAIPINEVKSIIESVQKHGRIVRPFLGVRYTLLNEDIAQANGIEGITKGALIVQGETPADLAVVPGSPADKAGIVENDIILKIDNTEVTQERGLAALLATFAPGDTITITLYHDGEIHDVRATLVERKE